MIQIDTKTFLECFPCHAALIGPDRSVLQVNSLLAGKTEGKPGGTCHEVLAGRSEACPFCRFDDILAGKADDIVDTRIHEGGCSVSVSLRRVRTEEQGDCLLETRAMIGAADKSYRQETTASHHHVLVEMCRLLLRLPGEASHDESLEGTVERIAGLVESILPRNGPVKLWIELDGRVHGPAGNEGANPTFEAAIVDGGEHVGRVCVQTTELSGSAETVLRALAEMVGGQLALGYRLQRLDESGKRFKKLAENLAKEMWSRTDALAKETSYLEGILQSSDDMIITTDLDGCIVEFNPGAERILGYEADEVQGRPVSELWEHAEERERIMAKVRSGRGVRNYETRLRTKDGDFRDISLTLSVLRDVEGRTRGTIGISKDITREKAIVRELERLNRNYRETIHFISHETKNALIVIGGFVNRLLRNEEDPEKRDHLQTVFHHSKFLEAMSKDFLLLAELEHGEMLPRKKLIKDFYKEVIYPAMVGLRERYPDSFDTYDTSMGGVGAIRLHGDPGLLEIVYRNLFGNALKYRYPDGKISYGVREEREGFVFNVWNEGPGVDPDQVDKIFDKFYRADDETTRSKKGTGLGLYNIRRIIEAHGGRIWCETRPGKWVNFLFLLPKE